MTSHEKIKYRKTAKWKNFRKSILDKNDRKCQICGIRKPGKQSKGLHLHHYNELAYGRETSNDVILLCAECHKLIEKMLKRKVFDIAGFSKRLRNVYFLSGGK